MNLKISNNQAKKTKLFFILNYIYLYILYMKRKTNLFYDANLDESKFITFSNYTESLTGNFLNTETKLFPSRFICFNIPRLNDLTYNHSNELYSDMGTTELNYYATEEYNEIKKELLNTYIVGNYENKLSFLRDHYCSIDENYENHILPLEYLISCIKKFDNNSTIEYIGDITEQNYNGIYADTICLIDSSAIKCGELKSQINYDQTRRNYLKDNSSTYLYSWYSISNNGEELYEGPSQYKDIKPLLDTDTEYNISATYTSISLKEDYSSDGIKFNVIVPLFDVVNCSYIYNKTTIEQIREIDLTSNIDQLNNVVNIPLGMWFSGIDYVELNRDTTTKFAPSWSLTISSQFKPFPASSYTSDEMIGNKSVTEEFTTFSQVLTRQNELMNTLTVLNDNMALLNNRLTSMESKINNMLNTYSFDSLRKEIKENYDNAYNYSYSVLQYAESYISNLVWKYNL